MIDAALLIQVLISSVALGLVYGLMSIGFTLMFGVMKIANYAHGALYMIGGYLALSLFTASKLPIWSALIITVVIMFGVGLVLELLSVETVKGDSNSSMIITVGIAIILEQVALMHWGGQFQNLPPLLPGIITISSFYLSTQQLISAIITLGIAVGIAQFLTRTKLGKGIQIVAYDREISSFLGISATRVGLVTFGIASATAGIAGVLLSALYPLYPSVGWPTVVIAFIVVILGGIGSIKGTIIAGILYAVAQNFAGIFYPSLTSIVGLVILIVVLFVRPQGLFGKELLERA